MFQVDIDSPTSDLKIFFLHVTKSLKHNTVQSLCNRVSDEHVYCTVSPYSVPKLRYEYYNVCHKLLKHNTIHSLCIYSVSDEHIVLNVPKLRYGPLTMNIKMCATSHKITQV